MSFSSAVDSLSHNGEIVNYVTCQPIQIDKLATREKYLFVIPKLCLRMKLKPIILLRKHIVFTHFFFSWCEMYPKL